jgi:hypothetical protein
MGQCRGDAQAWHYVTVLPQYRRIDRELISGSSVSGTWFRDWFHVKDRTPQVQAAKELKTAK